MFDCHVHAAPDVLDRIGDDTDIALAYAADGYDGFVLKGHYESTVGRAQAAARLTGLAIYGGIALNQHCGGVNPSAVAATLAAGGRVIWMPTADAHTQHTADLPRLCVHEPRIGTHTYAIPPVDMSALGAVDVILDLIAEHDAVIATGHLSGDECRWLTERAGRHEVSRVLLTHPSYTVPAMAVSEIAELAELGAHVEITCYQLLHQPGCTPGMLAAVARAAGDRLVLSSDAGQPDSPPPPQALQLLVDTLAGEGVDRGLLLAAAGEIPMTLFAP